VEQKLSETNYASYEKEKQRHIAEQVSAMLAYFSD